MNRPSLTKFAWLSVGAAVVTILLKAGAYAVTGLPARVVVSAGPQ